MSFSSTPCCLEYLDVTTMQSKYLKLNWVWLLMQDFKNFEEENNQMSTRIPGTLPRQLLLNELVSPGLDISVTTGRHNETRRFVNI